MSDTGGRFNLFLSNLQLKDSELEDAIKKHNGVRKTLHNIYYGGTGKTAMQEANEEYAFAESMLSAYKSSEVPTDTSTYRQTSILVGSYGKNTEIRPPSDIDILFIMPSHYFDRYNNYSYNSQSALLQDVKEALKKVYPLTDIKADGQIVLVPFSTYKVEVLPAFSYYGDVYRYPDTNNGGKWRNTAPKSEKNNISTSNN